MSKASETLLGDIDAKIYHESVTLMNDISLYCCNKIFYCPALLAQNPIISVIASRPLPYVLGKNTYNWRASEASETLSGVYKFELVRYIYILLH